MKACFKRNPRTMPFSIFRLGWYLGSLVFVFVAHVFSFNVQGVPYPVIPAFLMMVAAALLHWVVFAVWWTFNRREYERYKSRFG